VDVTFVTFTNFDWRISMATKMQPISTHLPSVTIEYDCGAKSDRRTKLFKDPYKAKRFYTAKDKAGKNPKVIKSP
jgi:hypothetical protein